LPEWTDYYERGIVPTTDTSFHGRTGVATRNCRHLYAAAEWRFVTCLSPGTDTLGWMLC
jgi:hypothetical protein